MGMLPNIAKKDTSNATDVAEKPKVVIPKAGAAAAAATEQVAAAAEPVAAASPAPVPAAAAASAVSTKVARKARNAIEDTFRGRMELEWNTLPRIQANQGNFLDMENNKTAFGNEIVVQLMSYQPSWQLSPGTDDASDIEHVKYSNDGVTSQDGYDLKEYLAGLKAAGYPKAKINARYMMALAIEETPGDKTGKHLGKLVQIDMSESSKKAFDQFMMTTSYQESRGLITPEVAEAGRLRMTAKVKSAGGFSWTVIEFEHAPA